MNTFARILLSSTLVMILASSALGQRRPRDFDTPRPIEALDTVFIEEMTWMEVRDAIKAGKTTVIVAAGGIEQNGPYLATGKHNYILQATTDAIARKLGNALVAPIIKLVPEGNHEPPSGHLLYPGTISLRQETFMSVLEDVCASFKVHGITDIVLLADSGGNGRGMKEVAENLTSKWSGQNTRVYYIPEYYDYAGLNAWLEEQGIKQVDEGLHDDYGITAIMMTVDPKTVRMKQRRAKDLFSINGVKLDPAEKTIEMGKKAVEFRTNLTVTAIRAAIAKKPEGK